MTRALLPLQFVTGQPAFEDVLITPQRIRINLWIWRSNRVFPYYLGVVAIDENVGVRLTITNTPSNFIFSGDRRANIAINNMCCWEVLFEGTEFRRELHSGTVAMEWSSTATHNPALSCPSPQPQLQLQYNRMNSFLRHHRSKQNRAPPRGVKTNKHA
jgi:hypothetical protein